MAHVNNHSSRRSRSWARPAPLVGAMLGILTLTLTACGGDDEDSTSMATTFDDVGEGADAIAPAVTEAAAETFSEAATEATEAPTTLEAPAFDGSDSAGAAPAPQRLLDIEVTVAVEVADVSAAVPQVVTIAERHRGQVYGSDVQLGDPDTARGKIIIKLPPDEVEATITDMVALGRSTGRFQNTDDVTARVTDVETRIISQQQSVDRVQALLAEAKDLGEVVLLEGELTARQLVLEELFAQQRNLRNSTALATLTVDLTVAPKETTATTVPTTVPADDETVGDAFATGGRAFLTAGTAVLIFLGYTAPFVALMLLGLWIARAIIRRRAPRSRSVAPLLPPAQGEGPRTTAPDSAGAARS